MVQPPPPKVMKTMADERSLPEDHEHYVTKALQREIKNDHFRLKRNIHRNGCFQFFTQPGILLRDMRPCSGSEKASDESVTGRESEKAVYNDKSILCLLFEK
jgi:hypothetical protein